MNHKNYTNWCLFCAHSQGVPEQCLFCAHSQGVPEHPLCVPSRQGLQMVLVDLDIPPSLCCSPIAPYDIVLSFNNVLWLLITRFMISDGFAGRFPEADNISILTGVVLVSNLFSLSKVEVATHNHHYVFSSPKLLTFTPYCYCFQLLKHTRLYRLVG